MVSAFSASSNFFSQDLNIYQEAKIKFEVETHTSTVLAWIVVGGVGVTSGLHCCAFSNLVHQFKFRATRGE
jgi:hypothetical protein